MRNKYSLVINNSDLNYEHVVQLTQALSYPSAPKLKVEVMAALEACQTLLSNSRLKKKRKKEHLITLES